MAEEKLVRFLETFPEWDTYGTPISREVGISIILQIIDVGRDLHVYAGPATHGGIIIVVQHEDSELIIDVYPDADPPSFLLCLNVAEIEGIVGDRFPVSDLVKLLMGGESNSSNQEG